VSRAEDAELIREVTAYIEVANAANRRQEWVVTGLLVALAVVGLGMLIYGAVAQAWQLVIPGGLIQSAVVLPIRKLIKLREENKALQIPPQLLRLADNKGARALAAKLILRLIEKV
jgi:hypothetical protein